MASRRVADSASSKAAQIGKVVSFADGEKVAVGLNGMDGHDTDEASDVTDGAKPALEEKARLAGSSLGNKSLAASAPMLAGCQHAAEDEWRVICS